MSRTLTRSGPGAADLEARPAMVACRRPLYAMAVGLALTGALAACSTAPEPIAFKNHVFYNYDDPEAYVSPFEQRYPPLDLAEQAPNPEYIGVSVIGSSIHLSRPKGWVIRVASNQAEHRYIEYVSPNQYVFAIYERVDAPQDPWRDVLGRYEDAAKADGAELLGMRVPISTHNAQGRAYVVRRTIPASKAPFVTTSREILARSDHRIVLVQIVHQTATLKPVSDELLRVIQTLEVD